MQEIEWFKFCENLISSRILPPIKFKPKILKQNYFTIELVEDFKACPPLFRNMDISSFWNKIEENCNMSESNESLMLSTKIVPMIEEEKPNSKEDKWTDKIELRVSKNGHPITSLHFNNPTDSFATRCDVIYKTLLRDWRKYFTDKFQVKMIKKNKNPQKLEKELDEFVELHFWKLSPKMIKDVKFYLGCLVYPKELVSNRAGLYDENSNSIKGSERSKKIKKIKELHTFLYNFSLEKWEKFFENEALWKIFLHYIQMIEDRIKNSSTMNNNREVYMAALKLIMAKIESKLSLSS